MTQDNGSTGRTHSQNKAKWRAVSRRLGSPGAAVAASFAAGIITIGLIAHTQNRAMAAAKRRAPDASAIAYVSKGDMERLIPLYAADIHTSFRIIVRSYDVHLSCDAATAYRQLWIKNPKDPVAKAEYAFSYTVALAAGTYDVIDPATLESRRELANLTWEADKCRDQSVAALPKSAEVLLMDADYEEQIAHFTVSKQRTEEALKLSPNWGFAHYWHAKTLVDLMIGEHTEFQRDSDARTALSELDRANQLDPSFGPNHGDFLRVHAYTQLRQYQLAIRWLDVCIGEIKHDATKQDPNNNLEAWRASLVQQMRPSRVTTVSSSGAPRPDSQPRLLRGDQGLTHNALGRRGLPDDVAGVVTFLCSDLSSFVTGQAIRVNGAAL